jgi:alpha-tubulin suppressor-like RCC1 family protein
MRWKVLRAALVMIVMVGVAGFPQGPSLGRVRGELEAERSPAEPGTVLESPGAISAGMGYACALTEAGGVKCWGSNWTGQLGTGTFESSLTPVDVSGLSSGVSAVSAGIIHTCALTSGGGVKCWGFGWDGRLGDGTNETQLEPVDVTGLSSGVRAVAAGTTHTCALTSAGGVKCWGGNLYGQLGIGTTYGKNTPQDVIGLTTGVSAVATGRDYTCAVIDSGGVKCWGKYLGENQLTPVDVTGLSSGASAISAGESHICVLTSAGGIKCWGDNEYGQLGDGSTENRLIPVDVTGLSSGVSSVEAGSTHTCALTTAGGVKCWGENYDGRLGDGTTVERLTPVDVFGLSSVINEVSAGYDHTCAMTSTGDVQCWGFGGYGELGVPIILTRPAPIDVTGLSSGANAVTAGYAHTCALTSAGGVKCWGSNQYGRLGDGSTASRPTPGDVVGLNSGVNAVSAGQEHTCALTSAGGVKCWGFNGSGELGDGSTQRRLTPVDVTGLTSGVSMVTTGDQYTCALTTAGGIKCWGFNGSGQLGDGSTTDRLTPVNVTGLTSGVTMVTAGLDHTCALTTAGGVKCWGANYTGQVGDGSTERRLTPVDVTGLSSGVSAVIAGGFHTCALTTAGGVKCWGGNMQGALGDGTDTFRTTPVDVTGLSSGVSKVTAGLWHTCALTTAGAAKCWGSNAGGQLGDGSETIRLTPVDVAGLNSGVSSISAGWQHTCAVTAAGGAKCWGIIGHGQLGDGSAAYSLYPGHVGWEGNGNGNGLTYYLYVPIIVR